MSVGRLEIRLDAKGYIQTYGIHYDEKFSFVTRISYICEIISLHANLDQPLYQLGVKNAIFQDYLPREVYMSNCLGLLLNHFFWGGG